MTRSEAKKKLQSLVNKIDREHGTTARLSVLSEHGQVKNVVVNDLVGESITAAKKEIRAWAKKNKVKLRWLIK